MTGDEADRILFRISSIWPQTTITDGTISIWRSYLQEPTYTFDTVTRAIDRLAGESKWWPPWATLVETVAATKRADDSTTRGLPEGDRQCLPLAETAKRAHAARMLLRESETC
tara:strand:+ start:1102 stop:1440 length:339 start_codon:yes stop_codon:yes gene_type:complete